MKEVTGQNLGMFWTKVCRTVLGEVNDLQTANKTEDNVCKINHMVYIIYKTTHERQVGNNAKRRNVSCMCSLTKQAFPNNALSDGIMGFDWSFKAVIYLK